MGARVDDDACPPLRGEAEGGETGQAGHLVSPGSRRIHHPGCVGDGAVLASHLPYPATSAKPRHPGIERHRAAVGAHPVEKALMDGSDIHVEGVLDRRRHRVARPKRRHELARLIKADLAHLLTGGKEGFEIRLLARGGEGEHRARGDQRMIGETGAGIEEEGAGGGGEEAHFFRPVIEDPDRRRTAGAVIARHLFRLQHEGARLRREMRRRRRARHATPDHDHVEDIAHRCTSSAKLGKSAGIGKRRNGGGEKGQEMKRAAARRAERALSSNRHRTVIETWRMPPPARR